MSQVKLAPIVYINGKWVPEREATISVLDYGLQYGDGVFEGIRIYEGSIFKLDEHVDRLFRSMRAIKIQPPLSKEEFKNICIELVRRNVLKNGHMKIIVTRGEGHYMGKSEAPPTVVVFGRALGAYYGEKLERGLRLKTSYLRRNPPECLDPRIKSLNYLNNVLSRLEAESSGADDALILDIQGYISEASGANFFIVKNNVLKTPRKYNVLEGITRETIMDLAIKAGNKVSEEDLTLYDVYTADEAFLCGSAAEITPVIEVDGRKIGGLGPITRKLQELFHELTHRQGPWLTKVL